MNIYLNVITTNSRKYLIENVVVLFKECYLSQNVIQPKYLEDKTYLNWKLTSA